MKAILLTALMSVSSFAAIPHGQYKIEKIQCKTGHVMKLGGAFMVYDILLNVGEGIMTMTATANSRPWAPFRLRCTQVNKGSYTLTQVNTYEGDLPNTSVECNAETWTNILKKKLFGVEAYGTFTYNVQGNKLTIFNPNTITKYSCDGAGDYPIYYYNKI